jgi:hypothetical protein
MENQHQLSRRPIKMKKTERTKQLTPALDRARTTPIGMLRYAEDFMEAAIAAQEKMRSNSASIDIAPAPVLFLVGHAIELSLKSFLLTRDVTLEALRSRDYGHQLHRCLRKAKELELLDLVEITTDENDALTLLDDLYASKQLQYIVTGLKRYPPFRPIEQLALKLIYAIGREVGFPPKRLPHPDSRSVTI